MISVEFILQPCSLCSFFYTEASDLSQDTKMSVSMYLYLCRSIIYASLMHPQLVSLYCLPFSLSALYWHVFEEYLHVSKLCVSLYWQILSSNILQGVYCSFFQCYFTSARLYTLELSAWMMSCCVEKEFSC